MDASQAGEGKLDVTVTCQGVEVRADISPIGRGRYEVTFVPREVATHFVDVQFNDTQVDGKQTPLFLRARVFSSRFDRCRRVYKSVIFFMLDFHFVQIVLFCTTLNINFFDLILFVLNI